MADGHDFVYPITPNRPEGFPGALSDIDGDIDPRTNGTPHPNANRRSSSHDRAQRNDQNRSRSRKSRSRDYDRGDATDYDGTPAHTRSTRSNRPLRYDDRDEWDEDDYGDRNSREYYRNPDYYNRRSMRSARPPRAFLNRANFDETEPSSSKQWFEGTLSQRPGRSVDEEMGYGHMAGNRVDWKALSNEEKPEVLHLPWTQWMDSNSKNHFVAATGEFIGTTFFLILAFAATEVANIQSKANSSGNASDSNSTTGGATGFDISVLLYISLGFGFSLLVTVWIFFRISGGLFNPAVTLAMAMVKAISVPRAVCLFIAQILGALLASVVVRFLFPENFNVRTKLSGGTSIVQGFFIEALLTSLLVFTILMLAKEKHRATFIAPVGIGLALFISEMVGVQFTGGSLNPARSFGPCVVTLTFDQEHWIYWIGPLIGSLFAVLFYKFIKTLEYEVVNPGADGDPSNDPTVNPEKRAEKRAELPSARRG